MQYLAAGHRLLNLKGHLLHCTVLYEWNAIIKSSRTVAAFWGLILHVLMPELVKMYTSGSSSFWASFKPGVFALKMRLESHLAFTPVKTL